MHGAVNETLHPLHGKDEGGDYLDAVRKPFQGVAMKKKTASALVLLCLITLHLRVAAEQTSDWGHGMTPFAFALIGDMPYGEAREKPFERLVKEINKDNEVD